MGRPARARPHSDKRSPAAGLIRTSRPAFARPLHGLFHGRDAAAIYPSIQRTHVAGVVLLVARRARRGRSESGERLGERRGGEEAARPVHQCAAATATNQSVRRYGCRRRLPEMQPLAAGRWSMVRFDVMRHALAARPSPQSRRGRTGAFSEHRLCLTDIKTHAGFKKRYEDPCP
jgi:hypothetical protein